MTDELKPVRCGCGGEAKVYVYSMDGGFWHRYNVECTKCNVRTPKYDTVTEAVTAWNRAMSGSTEKSSTVERTAKVRDKKDDPMVDEQYHGRCMNCGKQVRRRDNYCSRCGCRLIWGDDDE